MTDTRIEIVESIARSLFHDATTLRAVGEYDLAYLVEDAARRTARRDAELRPEKAP